jgi:predicted small lipoprotein YifL
VSRALVALWLLAWLCGCGPKGPVAGPSPEPACAADSECEPGQQCREHACQPYEGQLDDPCYDDLDCALELRCTKGVCTDPTGSDHESG